MEKYVIVRYERSQIARKGLGRMELFKWALRAEEVAEWTGLSIDDAERYGPWFAWLEEPEPESIFGDLL